MANYSGKSLGTFGELGGELEFAWEPPGGPEEVANELLAVSGYLEDIAGPLTLSREVLKNDIRMRFQTKVDPEGTPWPEWSFSYSAYREANYPNGGILVRTGELEQTATADEAFVQSEESIFYNTGGLPPYWLWTEQGATRSTPNAPAPLSEKEAAHMASTLGVSVQTLREVQGGGNELPARPFVGPSFEAEIEVIEIFDKWFDGAITLGMSSKGKVFGRYSYRGPGGQFVSRG